MRSKELFAILATCLISLSLFGGEVRQYTKNVDLTIGGKAKKTISQKRWYLENDFVKLGVVDDPGGAVVEFTNKANGVNHAAGEVYKMEVDGKTTRKAGWGWCEFMYDDASDAKEQWMYYQPFTLKFVDGNNGSKSIIATGHTKEQRIVRVMTLKPGSPELRVKITLTNIGDNNRPLWLRWHPQIFPSNDVKGLHGCVLSPAEGDSVCKINTRTGWDNWFSTYDGYWLAIDYKSGDGIFNTFEKEKVPIHFTWTQHKYGRPTSGAVTLEPFPREIMSKPGESINLTFTYFPFSAKTDPAKIAMGVLSDPKEKARASSFLKRAIPVSHARQFGGYTYAKTIQFPWGHRRRDKFGLRDWGWADCAIMGYPYQNKPLRIRFTGGFFPKASKLKGYQWSWKPGIRYIVTVTNQDGVIVYKNDINRGNPDYCLCSPFAPGKNTYDREIEVPMNGVPDGTYTLKVETLDPITKKSCHTYTRKLEVFGERFKKAKEKLAAKLDSGKDAFARPFVRALAKLAEVKVENGKTTIPIGVEDGSNTVRHDFPVTLGVPFPQGDFQTNATYRLISPKGETTPAQFRVMNVWPDKSLKWLQVDFQATCPANGFDFYKLEVDAHPAKSNSAKPLVSDSGDAVTVNTGTMKVVISKKKLDIPGKIYVDKNGDGKFGDDELVSNAAVAGSAWWIDAKGTVYKMTLKGESSRFFNPGVSIEGNGPLTAVVKLQGWYYAKNDVSKHPAYGEIRLKFFKGKARIEMTHQVTFTGSPWTDKLASYGLKLRLRENLYKKLVFDVDGKAFSAPSEASLYQRSFNRLIVNSDEKEIKAGLQSNGAVRMLADKGGFLFYHKNLWQMYPKKLEANAPKGELTVSYWPKEAGIHSYEPLEEYMIPSSSSPEACGTGASRTQEMVLDFSNSVSVVQAKNVYGEPVVACTPPKWMQKTNVVGNLQPYDMSKAPEVEDFIKKYINFVLRNRRFFRFYGQWTYGTVHNVFNIRDYTWRVVGRYANIGNEEDIVQAPWLLYMRSGDREYLKFAKLWTRHLMEIQSIRWHDLYPKCVGMSRRHHYTAWLGNGDYGHTMLCQYLEYYHCTGYRPAWQMAKNTARAMADTEKDATWRYLSNPIIGNIRMYLETGDAKYKKVADDLWTRLCDFDRSEWFGASHGGRMARWYAPFNKHCMKAWREWSKTGIPDKKKSYYKYPFRQVDTLAAMGDLSGDDWYAYQTRISFDSWRKKIQVGGVNPIYRGYVPYVMNTQAIMGLCRMLATGKGQIVKAQKLFPMGLYDLGRTLKKVLIKEDIDKAFKIRVSGRRPNAFKLIAPNGKPAKFAIREVCAPNAGREGYYEMSVEKDGQTGTYVMPAFPLFHFGCDIAKTAFVVGNSLYGTGEPLYVRSDDLANADGTTSFLMNGHPVASLEIFTMDGRRLFSKSMVRPPSDAVGVKFSLKLPKNVLLRLGDRTGVRFPKLKSIVLFPNKNEYWRLK